MLLILFAPIIFYGNILPSLGTDADIMQINTLMNYFRLLFIYIPTIIFILIKV